MLHHVYLHKFCVSTCPCVCVCVFMYTQVREASDMLTIKQCCTKMHKMCVCEGVCVIHVIHASNVRVCVCENAGAWGVGHADQEASRIRQANRKPRARRNGAALRDVHVHDAYVGCLRTPRLGKYTWVMYNESCDITCESCRVYMSHVTCEWDVSHSVGVMLHTCNTTCVVLHACAFDLSTLSSIRRKCTIPDDRWVMLHDVWGVLQKSQSHTTHMNLCHKYSKVFSKLGGQLSAARGAPHNDGFTNDSTTPVCISV